MPCDYSKYPAEWNEIRDRILARAGGNSTGDVRIGARCEQCGAENWEPHPETGSKVVLTIAHLDDPDPMNTADDNLAALCQKCHNSRDAPMRARNRAIKRRTQEIHNGQMELLRMEIKVDMEKIEQHDVDLFNEELNGELVEYVMTLEDRNILLRAALALAIATLDLVSLTLEMPTKNEGEDNGK